MNKSQLTDKLILVAIKYELDKKDLIPLGYSDLVLNNVITNLRDGEVVIGIKQSTYNNLCKKGLKRIETLELRESHFTDNLQGYYDVDLGIYFIECNLKLRDKPSDVFSFVTLMYTQAWLRASNNVSLLTKLNAYTKDRLRNITDNFNVGRGIY